MVCAQISSYRVSTVQFTMVKKVIRWLFSSFIQRYRQQYLFALSLGESTDQRLINMCRGVWSIIQYCHKRRKELRRRERLQHRKKSRSIKTSWQKLWKWWTLLTTKYWDQISWYVMKFSPSGLHKQNNTKKFEPWLRKYFLIDFMHWRHCTAMLGIEAIALYALVICCWHFADNCVYTYM